MVGRPSRHLNGSRSDPVEAGRREELVVGGSRTTYRVYGENSARHRVVALHGLRGTHDGLVPLVDRLVDTQVVVPDLPGFGASGPLAGGAHDVDGYAQWACEFVAAVAPGSVLLGHSFGSVVAAAVAGRAPVRALVLVNPIADRCAGGRFDAARALTLLYHRAAAGLPEPVGTALLRNRMITWLASAAMVTTADPALRSWIHAEHDRHFNRFVDRRVLLEAFAAAIGDDVGEYAASVAVPTLVVAGERDKIAPMASQHRLVERLPDARLVVLAGTGHLAHYEAPGSIAAATVAFLAERAS